MRKTDSQKLDQIIGMLGDIVDVFGKRFDRIDERGDKTDARIDGVTVKVDDVQNTLDREADVRKDQKISERVGTIEKHLGLNKKIAA